MLQPSDKCVALVKAYEGCRLVAYPDPATGGDPWTVGYGETGPDIKHGTIWSQATAETRLIARIANVGHQVRVALGGAETTQGQFDALTALTYNIGIGNLTTSTLLKLHIAGKYTNAAKEFGKWVKAAGKTMPGLVKRRAAETVLYAS